MQFHERQRPLPMRIEHLDSGALILGRVQITYESTTKSAVD